jgi:hypothetical protein
MAGVQEELVRGSLLYSGPGYRIYGTDTDELAIMEWDDAAASELAFRLCSALRQHGLDTALVRRRGDRSLVIRRLEPFDLTVLTRSEGSESTASFQDGTGALLSREEVGRIPGVRASRLSVMEDAALHATRCLRARLHLVSPMELRFRFGLGPGGECLLQPISPPECQFGTTDYTALSEAIGGDST